MNTKQQIGWAYDTHRNPKNNADSVIKTACYTWKTSELYKFDMDAK